MKGEELVFQLSSHISQLNTDQARILDYILQLEYLLEDYRTFVSRAKVSTMDDIAAKLNLLAKTDKIMGPVPEQQPEKKDPGAPIGGLYLYEVDRDEAEKKKRQEEQG